MTKQLAILSKNYVLFFLLLTPWGNVVAQNSQETNDCTFKLMMLEWADQMVSSIQDDVQISDDKIISEFLGSQKAIADDASRQLIKTVLEDPKVLQKADVRQQALLLYKRGVLTVLMGTVLGRGAVQENLVRDPAQREKINSWMQDGALLNDPVVQQEAIRTVSQITQSMTLYFTLKLLSLNDKILNGKDKEQVLAWIANPLLLDDVAVQAEAQKIIKKYSLEATPEVAPAPEVSMEDSIKRIIGKVKLARKLVLPIYVVIRKFLYLNVLATGHASSVTWTPWLIDKAFGALFSMIETMNDVAAMIENGMNGGDALGAVNDGIHRVRDGSSIYDISSYIDEKVKDRTGSLNKYFFQQRKAEFKDFCGKGFSTPILHPVVPPTSSGKLDQLEADDAVLSKQSFDGKTVEKRKAEFKDFCEKGFDSYQSAPVVRPAVPASSGKLDQLGADDAVLSKQAHDGKTVEQRKAEFKEFCEKGFDSYQSAPPVRPSSGKLDQLAADDVVLSKQAHDKAVAQATNDVANEIKTNGMQGKVLYFYDVFDSTMDYFIEEAVETLVLKKLKIPQAAQRLMWKNSFARFFRTSLILKVLPTYLYYLVYGDGVGSFNRYKPFAAAIQSVGKLLEGDVKRYVISFAQGQPDHEGKGFLDRMRDQTGGLVGPNLVELCLKLATPYAVVPTANRCNEWYEQLMNKKKAEDVTPFLTYKDYFGGKSDRERFLEKVISYAVRNLIFYWGPSVVHTVRPGVSAWCWEKFRNFMGFLTRRGLIPAEMSMMVEMLAPQLGNIALIAHMSSHVEMSVFDRDIVMKQAQSKDPSRMYDYYIAYWIGEWVGELVANYCVPKLVRPKPA